MLTEMYQNGKRRQISLLRLVFSFARVKGDDVSGVAMSIWRGRLFPLKRNCGWLELALLNIK